ncbi:tetratricopeptide repeat protein [Butyrivibrio sp. AE2032]|uniref:tetratricopeptide repeat protein n=1 Tax=Butyrivibrio sp. AE2032 TaxID=1458463 RepID=UPI0005589FF3|nr:tetratricopeptide repeat protein [Butyrivibrio sp. AE2032]
MATLKSYTCSKCAGILVFDSDQEFFDCPFCGNKYDIVDFHADEVLSQARSCLEQRSFSAAKEKFDQILDNDPENFEALLGSVLCVLNLSSIEELYNYENLSGCDITEAKKVLINAKRSSVNAKAGYFSKFIEVIGNYEKIVAAYKEIRALQSGDTKEKINKKMVSNYQDDRLRDRLDLPWFWIIMGFCLFCGIVWPLSTLSGSLVVVIATMVGSFVAVGLIIHFIHKADALHDEAYQPGNIYKSALDHKIEKYENEYIVSCEELKKIYSSAAAEKNEADSVVKGDASADTDINADRDIICEKCGASLSLDKEKRVYECSHCGVAYGVSLFFGLPMEKALNALNTGDYSDAEKRFAHLLMVNPSDFEALLGRILCAGKWTNVSDIRLSSDYEQSDIQEVDLRLDEAIQHAADNDRQFFKDLVKLIDFFEPYMKARKVLEAQQKEVSDMETKADVYATAFAGANYDENYKKERQKLVSKSYPALVQLKKMEGDFALLKKKLISAGNGCRLVG